jgi:DNA-binding NtrC family response regulator
MKDQEQAAELQAIASHRGSRADLAKKLGISERSLYRKLKALQSQSKT